MKNLTELLSEAGSGFKQLPRTSALQALRTMLRAVDDIDTTMTTQLSFKKIGSLQLSDDPKASKKALTKLHNDVEDAIEVLESRLDAMFREIQKIK